MFVDSHCHIYSEYYDDIDKVMNDALESGVYKVINNAADIKSAEEIISLSKKYDNMFFALGIHPEVFNADFFALESLVLANLKNEKFIAIGEIGLDYHYGKDNKDKQIDLFKKQLKLAQDNNLPVIIHSRDATQDTLDIVKQYRVKGVIHCFSGSLEIAREYIKLGFFIGVNGVITFKNANLKEVIKEISLDHILLETDAPYLTPEPYRKYSNEPKYIPEIAGFLAELYGVSIDEVSQKTNKNITILFDI